MTSLATADLRDVPLSELAALDLGVLWKTIGRVLPGSSSPVPVAAFQSGL